MGADAPATIEQATGAEGVMPTTTSALLASGALALLTAGGIALAGCGGGEGEESETREASETGTKSTIPDSLRAVESGAEDTIDFALGDDRANATEAAKTLDEAAQGEAANDLMKAGIPATTIDQLRARADKVAAIAAEGEPVAVALAANRVLELVPGFFAAYSDPVPADVLRLDYLDFEVKLEALAGDRKKAAAAAGSLKMTWNGLRSQVVAAGGESEAKTFTDHVDSVESLLANGSDQEIADEAQHGLDLVDELESIYTD
jgi:hypothetical protein